MKRTFQTAVNEHGEMVLVRTQNMQDVLTWSYSAMIPIAVVNGSNLNNAYEIAISEQLKKLYLNKRNRPWINELLIETGVDTDTFPGQAFFKAAHLIFKSKIVKK